MNLIRNSLLALAALFATATQPAAAGIEVLGIEVLGIEVLGIEVLYHTKTTPAPPPGSTMEAVFIDEQGIEVLLGSEPIDPATGLATVSGPSSLIATHLRVRGPNGEVLGIEVLDLN